MAAAKALNDPSGNVAGFVTRGDGVQALYTFAPFLFAYGGRWLDDKGKPELASAPFINALKYYSEILRSAGPPTCSACSGRRPIRCSSRSAWRCSPTR